jgi:hypothetical protein
MTRTAWAPGRPTGHDDVPTQPVAVRHHQAARPRRASICIAVAVVIAIIGALGHPSWAGSSRPAVTPARQTDGVPRDQPGSDGGGAVGQADGVVPDGVTVFDAGFPAVAELDPGLLTALRRAARDAARAGVVFYVNSGWRSRAYQDQLLREAVARYGSETVAARWVATADTSLHVAGQAVDIGHADAVTWLSEHGAGYGLCQIYRNEPWHYELRADAARQGCPRMYADPTHDPRMQR